MTAPTVTRTYTVPETSTFSVHVMTFQELYDMVGRLAKRREELLQAYRELTPEQQANVLEELAEIQTTEDKE